MQLLWAAFLLMAKAHFSPAVKWLANCKN